LIPLGLEVVGAEALIGKTSQAGRRFVFVDA